MALLKKQEAICLELGNKDGLQASYGNQALILKAWGRLEEAMALLKKREVICRELGNKNGLQRSYGTRPDPETWGGLEEAMALLKKQEALCRELRNKDRPAAELRQPGRGPASLGPARGSHDTPRESRKCSVGSWATGAAWLTATGIGACSRAQTE